MVKGSVSFTKTRSSYFCDKVVERLPRLGITKRINCVHHSISVSTNDPLLAVPVESRHEWALCAHGRNLKPQNPQFFTSRCVSLPFGRVLILVRRVITNEFPGLGAVNHASEK